MREQFLKTVNYIRISDFYHHFLVSENTIIEKHILFLYNILKSHPPKYIVSNNLITQTYNEAPKHE